MADERAGRIEALFHAALAQVPSDRAAFLTTACAGNVSLQREVESLLQRASDADRFLPTQSARVQAPPIIGRTLGVYRIEAHIGAGAMGEVYRARDTRLGRDVAIKVLPPAFAADRDRLARLEREARLLASVNHPNIGGIHGLEDVEGLRFLVLELVPGDTLTEAIAASGRRPSLTIDAALDIACQIADALQAAHERGIIHRDLKPSNVKLTPAGQVKVLDFGLAKDLGTSHETSRDNATSDVGCGEGTETGVIMGTPAYMSPEQARGQAVDARTDIWAFGCVLFELLSGRRAFEGETASDTLAHVLERMPDWGALPRATPAAVRRLLHRCLQKDPRKRLRDIGDARLDLDEALGPDDESRAARSTDATTPRRMLRSFVPWILTATSLVAAVYFATGRPPPPPASQPVIQMSLAVPAGLWDGPFAGHVPLALSPDGTRIVYAAGDGKDGLYVRAFDQLDAVPLGHTEGAFGPFFSPDGRAIGFLGADNKIQVLSLDGGTPMTVCDAPFSAGADWSRDGRIVFSSNDNLWRVPATGGTPEEVTHANAGANAPARRRVESVVAHRYPQSLPDGSVLFTLVREELEFFSSEYEAEILLPNGSIKTVLSNARHARYVPPGYLVFSRDTRLMAAPFDLTGHDVTGTPVDMADGLRTSLLGAAVFAVSETGALAYGVGQGTATGIRTMLWVDPKTGVETPLPYPADRYVGARISPDGQSVAVRARRDAGATSAQHLLIANLTRGTLLQLTDRDTRGFTWSRDGRRLAFRTADGAVYQAPADRSQPSVQLFAAAILPAGSSAGSWSADGQRVFMGGLGEGQQSNDLWMIQRSSGPPSGTATPLLQTPFDEAFPVLSPDERWIAYVSDETGNGQVYVRPASGSGHVVPVSKSGGSLVFWIDHAIVYRELTPYKTDRVMIATAETAPELKIGAPKILAETKGIFQDVSRDGKRVLMFKEEGMADFDPPQRQINLTLGWIQAVQERAGRK